MNRMMIFGFMLFVLVITSVSFSTIQADADATRYVRENGSGDGTSWLTASGTLQSMIDEVHSLGGGEVWVASGTYMPTTITKPGSPRSVAFQMKDKVEIYGGFPDSGNPSWDQRDWNSNKTVCTGEIGDPGLVTDNCYHVFFHPSALMLSGSAVLDGFTITGGYADAASPGDYYEGGGMFNDGNASICEPVISNCIFTDNYGNYAGAISNDAASPTIRNCIFISNSAAVWGGAVANLLTSYPNYVNCVFHDNSAVAGGSAYNGFSSSAKFINCILWGNNPDEIINDFIPPAAPIIRYCDIDQAGYTSDGNIRQDPSWFGASNDDFHLQSASPCIDKGTNTATGIPEIDFEGDNRIIGGTADMGVDETTYTCVLVASSGTGGAVTTPGEGIYPYDCGTTVAIVAEASPCYSFVKWTGSGSPSIVNPGSPNMIITMDGDRAINADFILHSYELTIADDGNGTTVPAAGIHGPYDCGTEVGINAIPNLYYSFDQWTGDTGYLTGSVLQASNSVTIPDTDIGLTATFAVNKCDLTTSSSIGGSVANPGEGTYSYDCGTEVAIVAEASPCYSFVKWTGSGSPSVANPGSPNTTITMEGDRTIHADFVLKTYNLTIDQTGQCCSVNVLATGVDITIPGGGTDTVSIQCGDNATLTASGCNFDSWTGTDGGDIVGGNPGTILMDEDKSVTAGCSEGHTVTIECIPRIGQRVDGQYLLNVAIYNAGSAVYSPGNGILVSGPVAYGPYAGSATFTIASGKFTYEIPELVNSGSYVAVVSAWSTLENVKDEVSITGNTTVDMGTLTSGNYSVSSTSTDAEINNFDMSPLANGWGCSTGMACYENNRGADADESGVINNFDMSPLANNWGVYGPIDVN